MPTTAIDVLLSSARRVGEDFCWPAERSLEVIEALSSLSRAILGVELWQIENDGHPKILGWSQYSINTRRPWDEVVSDGARQAMDAVLGHAGDRSLWINFTWEIHPMVSTKPPKEFSHD